MNYFVNAIGRKGTLVLFVFAIVSTVEVFTSTGASKDFLDFALYVTGVFAGANVFEHFSKKVN